jgi:hypothetical protein
MFLGALAILRKATISFVMSVCRLVRPSVRPHGTTQISLDGFSWNLILGHFSKICHENSRFIKIWQEWRVLYMNISIHFPLTFLGQTHPRRDVKVLTRLSTRENFIEFHGCETFKTDSLHFRQYLAQFFLDLKMLQTKVVENVETHILYSVTFSLKSCRSWDNVEKYRRTGQTTDDSTAHAHYMLDTKGYKHTLSEYVIPITFLSQQWLN